MDGRAYDKLSDGKLIGIFNRTDRIYLAFCSLCRTFAGMMDDKEK